MKACLENVESIRFGESTAWTFELTKPHGTMQTAPSETVAVSKDVPGVVELRGLKGLDRIVCDRREREGSISMHPMIDAYRDEATSHDGVLVGMFTCRGCEPVRAVCVGPVVISTTDGC